MKKTLALFVVLVLSQTLVVCVNPLDKIREFFNKEAENIEKAFHEIESQTPNELMDIAKKIARENDVAKKAIEDAFNPHNWIKHLKEGKHESPKGPYFPYDFEVDPMCYKFENYYYRTYNGSCNWLRKGEAEIGVAGQPFGRDRPAHYAPGSFNTPRGGPNPRELSNSFFKNKRTKYWEHTFLLPSFIEFLVHDLMLSNSGTEPGDKYYISVPKCDPFYDPNCKGDVKMEFWRSARVPGTGEKSPREIINAQTAWIDLSSIYGRNKTENQKIRTGVDGKLKLEDDGYLPLNYPDYNFEMIGWDKNNLFAAPDPRANQDWGLMTLHILFVREHNRLCNLMKAEYPNWTDEQIFQAVRVILTIKILMIGDAYFEAYFTDMPKNIYGPANPLSIYMQWSGDPLVTPLMTWPWKPILTPQGRPEALPNEFSVGYRWHVLLPDHMPIVDERNNIVDFINIPETAFNASGLRKVGMDNVLRGLAIDSIPDFHSGYQDGYRNMRWDFHDPREGKNFDLAAWAIEHERERGLPTYNEYMAGYDGKVPFKPRKRFEDFTTDPELVNELKRLYKSPDEVDIMVGQEIDEEWWPHAHIPKSMLIVSFYTLFKASLTDRFVPQYNFFWCILVGKPWDCTTNNILQDLFWKPCPKLGGNAKWWDLTWVKEVGMGNEKRVFHDIIVKNTGIKCLQQNVFFLPNDQTNPIICHGPEDMPGPKGKSDLHFLLGGIFNIEPYTEYSKEFGDIMHFELSRGGVRVLVSSAEYMAQVFLSGSYDNRQNPDWFGYTYGRAAGHQDGTFEAAITNAQFPLEWQTNRWIMDEKIIPAYSSYVPEMNKIVRIYLHTLSKHVGEKHYEPYDESREFAFNLTGHFDFGPSLWKDPKLARSVFEASLTWLDTFDKFAPFTYPWSWVIFPWECKVNHALDTASSFMDKLIEQKKQAGDYGKDWFGLYLDTPVKGGDRLTQFTAKAVAWELLEANTGPFPTLVSYGLYLLGSNKDIQKKIFDEVSKLGNKDISLGDIHNMPILMNTVKEILRSYPAGGGINIRSAYRSNIMGGYDIPAKTSVVTSTYLTQIDPRYWKNPQQFNPDRWNDPSLPIPGSWTVFGDGARGCAGRQFALLAGSVTIAHIVRNFEVEYTASSPPEMGFTMFATFKSPVKVKLTARGSLHDEL